MKKKSLLVSVLLLVLVLNPLGLKYTEASGNQFPSKYDLRDENKVTSVREQGELGSCCYRCFRVPFKG